MGSGGTGGASGGGASAGNSGWGGTMNNSYTGGNLGGAGYAGAQSGGAGGSGMMGYGGGGQAGIMGSGWGGPGGSAGPQPVGGYVTMDSFGNRTYHAPSSPMTEAQRRASGAAPAIHAPASVVNKYKSVPGLKTPAASTQSPGTFIGRTPQGYNVYSGGTTSPGYVGGMSRPATGATSNYSGYGPQNPGGFSGAPGTGTRPGSTLGTVGGNFGGAPIGGGVGSGSYGGSTRYGGPR